VPRTAALLVATLLLALADRPARAAEELQVSAAASLSDVLKELVATWRANGGEPVALNLAGSSTLARQIELGAPADLFLSADEAQMDRVAKAGRLLDGSRHALLGNTLVVVTPADSLLAIRTPESLAAPAIRRIALADPQAVPAGVYARRWLTSIGLWTRIESRVVPLENVRAALAAVASGNVDAGIVYATDAAVCERCRVDLKVEGPRAPKIVYPLAILADSTHLEEARRFSAFLGSAAARTTFERWGFSTLP